MFGDAGAQLKEQVSALQTEYSKVSDQLESEQGRGQQVRSTAYGA